METAATSDSPVDWDIVLPPYIKCHVVTCNEPMIEGFKYKGRHVYFCNNCIESLPITVKEECAPFKYTEGVIDSRYIDKLQNVGTRFDDVSEKQILPVKIGLKRTLCPRCEHHSVRKHICVDEVYEVEVNMTQLEYYKLQVFVPKKDGGRTYFTRTSVDSSNNVILWTDKFPIVLPGDVIPIRNGISIKVHDSFEDPRVTIKKELDLKWEALYNDMKQNFPPTIGDFKEGIKLSKT